jgi:hypothetical protein
MWLSPNQYAAAMRRLEGMRNEARALNDGSALAAIRQREADLNRAFWPRLNRRP